MSSGITWGGNSSECVPSRGILPLCSEEEWQSLVVLVGGNLLAADSLKTPVTWKENKVLEDPYDFTMKVFGSKDESAIWNAPGYFASFWTSTMITHPDPQTNPDEGVYFKFIANTAIVIQYDALTTEDNRYSVRCIVDQ